VSRVQWNGKAFEQHIRAKSMASLKAAGLHLVSADKQQLAVSGRRTLKSALTETKSVRHSVSFAKDLTAPIKGRVRTVDGSGQSRSLSIMTVNRRKVGASVRTVHVASLPGEPPREQFGNLKKSVTMESFSDQLKVRVGIPRNTIYGFWLEVGTKRIKPRPWMLLTLKQQLPTLGRIAAGGA